MNFSERQTLLENPIKNLLGTTIISNLNIIFCSGANLIIELFRKIYRFLFYFIVKSWYYKNL